MKIQLNSIRSAVICAFVLLFETQSASALTVNEVAKLLADDGASFDHFGISVIHRW